MCVSDAVRPMLAAGLGGFRLLVLLIGGVLADAAFNGSCWNFTTIGESCSDGTGFAGMLLPPLVAATLFLIATRLLRLAWLTIVAVSVALPALLLLWMIVESR